MTPEQFVYWLQGQFELKGGDTDLSQDQIKMISDHLSTVFHKVTPSYPDINKEAVCEYFNKRKHYDKVHSYNDLSYYNEENHPTCSKCGHVDKSRELR